MHSEPSAAETVSKPCFSSTVFMTCTSVGESSTIMISAMACPPDVERASPPDVARNRSQQLVLRERLGQILLRTDEPSPRPIEQPVLAGQHDHRGIFEELVVLDQGAGLIAVETRHHDIDEDDVRLVICDLRQRVEPVDRRVNRASFLREQRLGSATDGLAVVDHKDLEALQARPRAYRVTGRHALLPALRRPPLPGCSHSGTARTQRAFEHIDETLPTTPSGGRKGCRPMAATEPGRASSRRRGTASREPW